MPQTLPLTFNERRYEFGNLAVVGDGVLEKANGGDCTVYPTLTFTLSLSLYGLPSFDDSN